LSLIECATKHYVYNISYLQLTEPLSIVPKHLLYVRADSWVSASWGL